MSLLRAFRQIFCKRNIFVLRKRPVFSIHAKPPNIRKAFSQHTAATISHRTQTNVQPQISSEKPCCKLAVQQPISEISQSCVSSTAFLSHRFKSSPSIPGKVALSDAAGYMMNAGHFSRNPRIERRFESSPESRGSQTSGVLPVLFVQAKRIKPFPFGSSRFCKPRISTPNQQLRTNPIKTF